MATKKECQHCGEPKDPRGLRLHELKCHSNPINTSEGSNREAATMASDTVNTEATLVGILENIDERLKALESADTPRADMAQTITLEQVPEPVRTVLFERAGTQLIERWVDAAQAAGVMDDLLRVMNAIDGVENQSMQAANRMETQPDGLNLGPVQFGG